MTLRKTITYSDNKYLRGFRKGKTGKICHNALVNQVCLSQYNVFGLWADKVSKATNSKERMPSDFLSARPHFDCNGDEDEYSKSQTVSLPIDFNFFVSKKVT